MEEREHHAVVRDPTMDHHIVHSVCVSNKKEQVHLKDKERCLQNSFQVQQHIMRREEKDLFKHLHKLQMEKHHRHPEIVADSFHSDQHDMDHHRKHHQISTPHGSSHHMRQSHTSNVFHKPSDSKTSTRWKDQHNRHHHYYSHPSNNSFMSSHPNEMQHQLHSHDHHLHDHQFGSSSYDSGFHGYSSDKFRMHSDNHYHHPHFQRDYDNNHHLPNISHHHPSDHRQHVHHNHYDARYDYDHEHHDHDYQHHTDSHHHVHDHDYQHHTDSHHHVHDHDYHHYTDSHPHVPGYMQPKRSENHHQHHNNEFVSLIKSCLNPRQPAGYGHSIKNSDKGGKSYNAYRHHGHGHDKNRRHFVDFDKDNNFRPVGCIHRMTHLTPNYHDRLLNHTDHNAASDHHPNGMTTTSRRHSFQEQVGNSHNASHKSMLEAPFDMGPRRRSLSKEMITKGPSKDGKNPSNRAVAVRSSEWESKQIVHTNNASKDSLKPHQNGNSNKNGEAVTRALNVTVKIKKGSTKKGNQNGIVEAPLEKERGKYIASKNANDLIIEDVSPPSSTDHVPLIEPGNIHEVHHQKQPVPNVKVVHKEKSTSKRQVAGITGSDMSQASHTSYANIASKGDDLAAETIAELEALSASAAQSFAPSSGIHSRRSHFQELAKELLMRKLPAIARQRQLSEFDPLEMLHCRYLRLSKSNVEELLELCSNAGVTIDIHPHMKIDDITKAVFDTLDESNPPSKEMSVQNISSS